MVAGKGLGVRTKRGATGKVSSGVERVLVGCSRVIVSTKCSNNHHCCNRTRLRIFRAVDERSFVRKAGSSAGIGEDAYRAKGMLTTIGTPNDKPLRWPFLRVFNRGVQGGAVRVSFRSPLPPRTRREQPRVRAPAHRGCGPERGNGRCNNDEGHPSRCPSQHGSSTELYSARTRAVAVRPTRPVRSRYCGSLPPRHPSRRRSPRRLRSSPSPRRPSAR